MNLILEKDIINRLTDFLNQIPRESGIELEWKLGKTVFKNNLLKFVPGIEESDFKKIEDNFSRQNVPFKEEKTIVSFYPNDIRVISFENGLEKYEKKVKIRDFNVSLQNNLSVRLSLSREYKTDTKPINEPIFKRYRNRKTYSFGDFVIDITKVSNKPSYETPYELPLVNFPSTSLSPQFPPPRDEYPNITYEVEIEFNKIPDIEGLQKPLKKLLQQFIEDRKNLMTYKLSMNYIGECNKLLERIEKPRMPSKTLINYTNKPRNLKLQDISDNYSVTNKLDGTRYQMFFLKSGIVIAHPKDIQFFSKKYIPEFENTILEGELYKNTFWIFDALMFHNEILINKNHENRISPVVKMLSENIPDIRLKQFYLGNIKNSLVECMKYIEKNFKEDENDGMILTPTDKPYINKETLKFKFPSRMTIDFRFRFVGKRELYDRIIYEGKAFVVGSEGEEEFSYEIDGRKGHWTIIIDPNKNGIVPPYEYTLPKDGEIIECGFTRNNVFPQGCFYPTRPRVDKQKPNFIKVARDVFYDILHPLEFSDLLRKIGIPFRKYHSSQKKEYILKECKSGDVVIDLGFGRGGDISKYQSAKVAKIWGIEPSLENLNEAKRRINDTKPNIEINMINEFAENTENILKQIDEKGDVVSMFFSLTFFFKSKELLIKLINTINSLLKVEGKFIGFTMDGVDTHRWLKGKEKIEEKDCYTIIKKYGDKKGIFDMEIEIDLSEEGEYKPIVVKQTEWLVHFDTLVKMLEEKGIKLVHTEMIEPPSNLSCGKDLVAKTRKFTFVKERETQEEEETEEEETEEEETEDTNSLKMDEIKPISLKIPGNWVRIGAIGDGSCFFHSILRALSELKENKVYKNLSREERIEVIKDLRKEIADDINIDDWMNIANGMYALISVINRYTKYVKKKVDTTPEFAEELKKIESKSDYLNDVREKLIEISEGEKRERLIKIFDFLCDKVYQEFLDRLINYRTYVGLNYPTENDVNVFEIVSNVLNINIFIISLTTRDKYFFQPPYKEDRKSVVLLNIEDIHFETLALKTEEGLKMVFEPNSEELQIFFK